MRESMLGHTEILLDGFARTFEPQHESPELFLVLIASMFHPENVDDVGE